MSKQIMWVESIKTFACAKIWERKGKAQELVKKEPSLKGKKAGIGRLAHTGASHRGLPFLHGWEKHKNKK